MDLGPPAERPSTILKGCERELDPSLVGRSVDVQKRRVSPWAHTKGQLNEIFVYGCSTKLLASRGPRDYRSGCSIPLCGEQQPEPDHGFTSHVPANTSRGALD